MWRNCSWLHPSSCNPTTELPRWKKAKLRSRSLHNNVPALLLYPPRPTDRPTDSTRSLLQWLRIDMRTTEERGVTRPVSLSVSHSFALQWAYNIPDCRAGEGGKRNDPRNMDKIHLHGILVKGYENASFRYCAVHSPWEVVEKLENYRPQSLLRTEICL